MTENTRPEDLNGENLLNTPKKGERTMSSAEKEQKRITRREFVKGAAVGAAGAAATGALAACGPTPEVVKETVEVEKVVEKEVPVEVTKEVEVIKEVEVKPWLPDKWDYEADVVVVGYGGSGAVTAITAHDAGAKVIILEKAPAEGGGCSRMSNANALWADNDNIDGLAQYMHYIGMGAISMDLCRVFAEYTNKIKGWYETMGIEYVENEGYAEWKDAPYADICKSLQPIGQGPSWWQVVDSHVKDRNIQILFDSPAQDLIQDPETKGILGVMAESQGEKIAIKGKKAVVLCTGDMGHNHEMRWNYLKAPNIISYGWKYNTGDGIIMGSKVGAELWRMNCAYGAAEAKVPEYEIAFRQRIPKDMFIQVDKYGKRYMDEKIHHANHGMWHSLTFFDFEVGEFPRIPSHVIFDETARLGGGVFRDSGLTTIPEYLGGAPVPSTDNIAEIDKGWIKKGDTIEELATKIGIDPINLKNTVDTYNGFCIAGNDSDFNRDPATMSPIETPPYYAIEVFPTAGGSYGGPKRNEKGQVMGLWGKAIPRLYSAGVMGQLLTFMHQGGICFGGIVSSGLLAGENAVKETPWD